MYVCQTLEDMNQLTRGYRNGGALGLTWFSMPIQILSFDNVVNLKDKNEMKKQDASPAYSSLVEKNLLQTAQIDNKAKEKSNGLENKINGLIKKVLNETSCSLMTFHNSSHKVDFRLDPAFAVLQKYAGILSSVGLKVRIEKECSLLDGLIKIPAKLYLDDSLSVIEERLTQLQSSQQKPSSAKTNMSNCS